MHPDLLRACPSERGQRNLAALAERLGPGAFGQLAGPLARLLPRCPDPDMALNNLERFFAHPAAVGQLPGLLDGRARTLEVLLQLLATSQLFSDLLVQQPDYLDTLRLPLRKSPGPAELREALQADVDAATDDAGVLRAFRRFCRCQELRVGTNDIIRDRPLEEITRDLSRVADAALEVALATAVRHVGKRFGEPTTGCAVLAFGKLGGEELNYSSDIDLMFVYGEEGQTRSRRAGGVPHDEFFGRVVGEVVRLLGSHTDRGQAFRVDLRLRPEGHRGPLARSLDSTLSYYDTLGRTWERQALIKVRPVAGDLVLGQRFLAAIEPFVYRKYLTFAEINEIKAMKRRIEQKASQAGVDATEVKTGKGGIRDIEFTIQFLQLLNGGDLPALRQRNTLLALAALEQAGCLTDQESRVLDDAYRFLRKTEHRLQLLFGLQTHRLPEGDEGLTRLALRMGYRSAAGPATAFRDDYRGKTEPTRHILDHLVHQTFAGTGETAEPESDLILNQDPDPETVRAVLGRYPFRDVQAAYANLAQLAQEVPFLSPRRCRHFLASIAPGLLRAVAETPDPDMALLNLEKVTGSLGGKTVLWELFSFNPPSLRLYVDLCANSQYLAEILINNPGMIDELLDSLVLNQPRTLAELRGELAELCKGATDPEPILHSFQDKELLRVGVRDVLGKDTIRETTQALSDVAEALLVQVAAGLEGPLTRRYGVPTLEAGERAGQPCRFAVLALGKLGAGEMNYHSDVDLMMVYEGDGRTAPPGRQEPIVNGHYFTEVGQRLIKELSHHGPMGRLYQVDMRLRPTGKSGSLVLPLDEFRRYFAGGGGQLWERQALTRARVVSGDGEFAAQLKAAVDEAVFAPRWRPEWVDEITAMRERLEASRPARDLKRGPGGLADVEFLAQTFQLKYGSALPAVRTPNTWQLLTALRAAGLISADEHEELSAGYGFLLRVQNRLRIVHNRALDAVPEAADEVGKLARRMGLDAGTRLLDELNGHRRRLRTLSRRLTARERGR